MTQAPSPQIANLHMKISAIFNRVVEHYHGDLAHDWEMLTRLDATKEHALNGYIVYWSVGNCGSHMGIYDDPTVAPIWLYPNSSYNKYEHYRLCLETGTVTPITWTDEQIARNA